LNKESNTRIKGKESSLILAHVNIPNKKKEQATGYNMNRKAFILTSITFILPATFMVGCSSTNKVPTGEQRNYEYVFRQR
jgi:hypothetical protein